MEPILQEIRQMTLAQADFADDAGNPRIGLVDAHSAAQHTETALRYSNLFEDMETNSDSTDLIYETPYTGASTRSPCAYIKAMPNPSPDEICAVRAKLWNHGRIPTLWVVSTQGLRIFDALARPEDANPSNYLLGQMDAANGRLPGIQEFSRKGFDDGSFWRHGAGRKINPANRVDCSLLQDLQETQILLRQNGLQPSIAHRILRQIIFIKYLEDRGALTPAHFHRYGAVNTFTELTANEPATRAFLAWMRESLNGDIFPQTPEHPGDVRAVHFDIIHRFLSGDRMQGYPNTQPRLWPYSFRLIPIELISNIYEMFAHSENPANAENISVHYTRFNLVELMLSRAMRDLPTTAKILDPACGSGAFLVEAFRRLAHKQAQRIGKPLTRSQLESILKYQIYGIDIDRDAVSVAAFSLYLALFEMATDPEDSLSLPNLISQPDDPRERNLYVQDFFNTEHLFNRVPPFADRSFDLIVSNPPWTVLNTEAAPRDPEDPEDGPQWGLQYVINHAVPRRNPDQGFLHRSRDFAGPDTTIDMVIGARFLHQSTTSSQRWRNEFFTNNSVHSIMDLSDLVNEDLLFGAQSSTHLPACIISFSRGAPKPHHQIEYTAPKRYGGLDQRNEIIVTSQDTQRYQQDLISDQTFRWKAALRGTPRDIRLLYRLNQHPTLDQALTAVGILTRRHRGRGITFGNGPQQDAERFRNLPFLPGREAKRRFSLDLDLLPTFERASISTKSSRLILRPPAIVIARALSQGRLAAALVEPTQERDKLVVTQSYYGISFPDELRWLAYRINATLNSEFALYWGFMTSSQIGLDRRLMEVADWLRLPLPISILEPNATAWQNALRFESALRNRPPELAHSVQLQESLDRAVYELYGCSHQDTLLMRDTVTHKVMPYLDESQRLTPDQPADEQIRDYALRVCRQLNGILSYLDQQFMPTIFTFPNSERVVACRFHLQPGDSEINIQTIACPDIQYLLDRISPGIRQSLAETLHIDPDIRVYDDDATWIIKADHPRLWTQTAALNDADLIMQEHMEADD